MALILIREKILKERRIQAAQLAMAMR